jgi:hypothetical protein
MFCLSSRFAQGVSAEGVTLDFTTEFITMKLTSNGELLTYRSEGYDCMTWTILTDSQYESPIPGTLYLNLPAWTEGSQDEAGGFFDTTRSVSGESDGRYEFLFLERTGSVRASWHREAESKDGTCVLELDGLGSFTFSFEILEYRGSILYTPGVSFVSADLAVSRTGAADETFGGSLQFDKSTWAPESMLHLVSGSLTNANGEELSYSPMENYTFDRFLDRPTNYSGYVMFRSTEPGASAPPYRWWVLSIDDLNDSDSDGIPDFSDSPSVRKAVLGIAKGSNGLELTIRADVGTTWKIEKSSSLIGGWVEAFAVAITSDPQIVPLTEPLEGTFWRALKE